MWHVHVMELCVKPSLHVLTSASRDRAQLAVMHHMQSLRVFVMSLSVVSPPCVPARQMSHERQSLSRDAGRQSLLLRL